VSNILNKFMGKKFDAIFEAVIGRDQAGGYLPGDIVVFRSNYKSTDCYKDLPKKTQQDLDEMVKSGLNIKVIHVGDNLSGSNANNQYKTSLNSVITVAADHGGGRYYSSITVTPDMVDFAENDGVNLPKIPDQFRRDDEYEFKPKKFERDNDFITNVTDKGNGKNTPTNFKLAGESTMIKNDNKNLSTLYESIYIDDEKTEDFGLIYEQYLNEGFLRRMATKIAGGFRSNPIQSKNRMHEFAQSVSLDVGKDISKSFGGDYKTHANNVYDYILKYLKKNTTPQQ